MIVVYYGEPDYTYIPNANPNKRDRTDLILPINWICVLLNLSKIKQKKAAKSNLAPHMNIELLNLEVTRKQSQYKRHNECCAIFFIEL